MRTALALLVLLTLGVSRATGQQPSTRSAATEPGVSTDAAAQVDALRDYLKAAYQKGDVQGMIRYLHPNVTIIFPDGQVLIGREALVAYYEKMLKAPDAVVQSYTSDPVVKERYRHGGDTVVSHGLMNDNYVLKDGTRFGLDSRFTVTALREQDGPPETGGWRIRSFHSSTDAFDNAVLNMAARKALRYGGVGGLIVGIVIGVILGMILGRRRRRAANERVALSPKGTTG